MRKALPIGKAVSISKEEKTMNRMVKGITQNGYRQYLKAPGNVSMDILSSRADLFLVSNGRSPLEVKEMQGYNFWRSNGISNARNITAAIDFIQHNNGGKRVTVWERIGTPLDITANTRDWQEVDMEEARRVYNTGDNVLIFTPYEEMIFPQLDADRDLPYCNVEYACGMAFVDIIAAKLETELSRGPFCAENFRFFVNC